MEMVKNDRAGAIQKMDKDSVWLIGFGVYIGDTMHPELGFPNPTIELDNGRKVFGAECWWNSEEKIKKMIEGKNIISVGDGWEDEK